MGKWIFEKITSANEPEKEIPLSPFPIKQPVVYHFNPVAFVEQMRRVDSCVIEIVRKWTYWSGENNSSATIGTFSISNSDITGYIAEPYGESTTIANQDKRIPPDTYNLTWHTSSKFPNNKYVNKGYAFLPNGFPKVFNDLVPQKRSILIHVGNTGSHSEGCLLPGAGLKKKKVNGIDTIIGVSESTDMFYQLIEYITKNHIENVKIKIIENYE